MNREECIKILKKGVYNNLSFLEDNKYRYQLQQSKTPTKEYNQIILEHQEEIDEINNAIKYLEKNLK